MRPRETPSRWLNRRYTITARMNGISRRVAQCRSRYKTISTWRYLIMTDRAIVDLTRGLNVSWCNLHIYQLNLSSTAICFMIFHLRLSIPFLIDVCIQCDYGVHDYIINIILKLMEKVVSLKKKIIFRSIYIYCELFY